MSEQSDIEAIAAKLSDECRPSFLERASDEKWRSNWIVNGDAHCSYFSEEQIAGMGDDMNGARLRSIREQMGMTQAQLANKIGLSQGFIGEMERGEKPVELRTRLALLYLHEHHLDGA